MLFKKRNVPSPLKTHFLFIYAPPEANNILNISFVTFLEKKKKKNVISTFPSNLLEGIKAAIYCI